MVAGVLAVWGATGNAWGAPLLGMGVDVHSSTATQATYELVVTNRGTAPAEDVVVTATVPRHATFEASSPAPSSGCDNGGVSEAPGVECTWDIGTPDAGAASSISVALNLVQGTRGYAIRYAAKARSSNADSNADIDRSLRREATNKQARPFRVSVQQEPATCIDADPDSAVTFIEDEFRIDALVTDGEKVEGDGSDDSCNGSPVSSPDVIFEVEVDEPDIYFSSEEGDATTKTVEGGDAQPNTVMTDPNSRGETFVGVSLDEPNSDNEGENRIGARIEGTEDPDDDIACSPIETDLCESESATEDDVRTTWSTTPPAPSPTGSPTASPTGSPTASPTPTPPPTVREASNITIRHNNRPHRFNGRVGSDRRRCRRGRRVVVKEVRRGRDGIVGRDTTNRRGRWSNAHRRGGRGRYYAIAKRKRFTTPNGTVICQKARSRRIRARR
jgi:uncharacterized repeat protein (TIGR01451 family)